MITQKWFSSKSLNQIILINISVYVLGFLMSLLINGFDKVFIYLFSIHSNLAFDYRLPSVFITHGFVHADFSHIFSNMLFFMLYYPLFSKISNTNIWKIYLWTVFICGIVWLLYLNLFGYTNSLLLGASGGIMALVSYSSTKWGDVVSLDLGYVKIRFKHLLSVQIVLSIINFVDGNNIGGELSHLTGVIVGYCFAKILTNKKSED